MIFQEMVSGGLIEQIESALLTKNQLCSVWQDISPDQYEHVPSDLDVSAGQHYGVSAGQHYGRRLDKAARGTVATRTR